jgi:hypothetical protein
MSNWRPHEPGENTRAAIVDQVVAIVRRPVRLNGNTLEVFDVDAKEQLPIQKKLREVLKEIGDSRVTVIFHTRGETQRLYADFVNNFPHHCHYTVEVNFDGKRKFFCDLCGGAF